MSRIATPFLLLLLSVAMFLAFFHPAMLDVGNPGWLIRASDNGENALGLHAYRHDPKAGASLRTTLLNAPEGVPVLFTDSNPLLTLATKPFGSLLPADAQFVGPFILLCLVLQALFAWLLLRPYTPGRLALWAGVVLLAFPPTLANRFIHANLMAHWTILAALWLALQPERRDRLRWWVPLILITGLIHSYLLVMVGAIWAAIMLPRFVAGDRRGRLAVVAQSAVVFALVALLAKWLGVGGQMSDGNFGAFAMPLDALWNPATQGYSRLLPASGTDAGRDFEAFQYMGAGGLLLILAAVLIARRVPARDGERAAAARLRDLVPALLALTLLAVVRILGLPDPVTALLDPIRASGRLFWPVGYVLVLMAILALYRLRADRAGLALAALVAVQAFDLSAMAQTIRAATAESEQRQLFVRTKDPRWDTLIRQARSVAFLPGKVSLDLGLFQEVAWRAARAQRPVTSVYAARLNQMTLDRLARERAAFDRGQLVPGRLYVLLPGQDVTVPAAAMPYRLQLDGVTVIPASSPR